MKVIKKGRKQVGWSQEFTCTGAGNGNGGCGAVLLVSEYDIYETLSEHYDGSTDYYQTFCCPECGNETDVKVDYSKVKGKRPSKEEREAIAKKAMTMTLSESSPEK